MMKRIICVVIALALFTSLFACSDSTKGGGSDTKESTTTDPNAGKSNLDIALEQQGNVNLEGMTFRILTPNPGSHFYYFSGATENEVFYEELGSEPLSNSIYMRNLEVSEKLGITIEPVWAGNTGDITAMVQQAVNAGDTDAFNVVLNRLDALVSNATNGLLLNYYNIDTMNLENKWWDKHIIDAFTMYGNKLYTLSGDINYYDDYAVEIVIFNHNICKDAGFDFPYKDVKEGTWTVDKMFTMAALGCSDLNGDGLFQENVDIVGIGENADCILHFIYSYGLKMSETDENGVPEVVWANDQNTSVIDELYNYFSDSTLVNISNSNATAFNNSKEFFYLDMLGTLANFRNMEDNFGILPMPKGDPSMDSYKAYVSNGWTTAYGIPSMFSNEQANKIGTVLECLSAASADHVTPALYDQLLQSKYIRDEESQEMLDYILDSKVYDWAGDLEWASSLRGVYQNILSKGSDSFASSMESIRRATTKSLEKLAESIAELEY